MNKDKEKQIKDVFKDFNIKVLDIKNQLLVIKENIDKRKNEETLKKTKNRKDIKL